MDIYSCFAKEKTVLLPQFSIIRVDGRFIQTGPREWRFESKAWRANDFNRAPRMPLPWRCDTRVVLDASDLVQIPKSQLSILIKYARKNLSPKRKRGGKEYRKNYQLIQWCPDTKSQRSIPSLPPCFLFFFSYLFLSAAQRQEESTCCVSLPIKSRTPYFLSAYSCPSWQSCRSFYLSS